MPIRRVLILGHTGFVGRSLETHLREKLPGVEMIGHSSAELDLTHRESVLKSQALFDRATAVVFCSAIKRQFSDGLDSFSKNVEMALNLCRILQERPVARLVYLSSAAIYGEDVHNLRITEQTPVQPRSYYGAAKIASEALFERVLAGPGQGSLLILRPPTIYGPGERVKTYGPGGFVKSVLAGEEITLWGNGTERREFMFIDDVVEAVRMLLLDDFSGIVNVVAGVSYSFVEALDIIARLTSLRPRVRSRPRTKNKADHGFDNSLLTRLVPGLRFTTLEDGIRRMLECP